MARVGNYTLESHENYYSYVLISRFEDKVIDVKRCFVEFESRTGHIGIDLLCRKNGTIIVILSDRYILYHLTPEGMIEEKSTIERKIESYDDGFGYYLLNIVPITQVYDSFNDALICEIPFKNERICVGNKIFTQSDVYNKIHVAIIKDSKYLDQGYIDNPHLGYRINNIGNQLVFRKAVEDRWYIKLVNQSTLELIKEYEVNVGEINEINGDFFVSLDQEEKFDARNGQMVKAGKFDIADLIIPEHLSTILKVKHDLFDIYYNWPKDLIKIVLNYLFTNELVDVC